LHFCQRFFFNAVHFRILQDAFAHQRGAETRDGIILHCGGKLGLLSIHFNGLMLRKLRWYRGHGDSVAVRAQAVKFRLDQTWTFPASGTVCRLLHRRVHFQGIRAVYGYAGNAESFGLLRQRIACDVIGILQADMRISLVMVVFEDVDDREFPHRSQVQRFEESSLFRRAISKKTINHLAGIFDLSGQSRTGGVRDGLTNNS
jgi:hypothetical protein